MNASDKLQLIRALEEREASRRRRSDLIAWGSVLVAAAIVGAMILAGRRELAQIERNVDVASRELKTKQEELATVNKEIARKQAAIDQARQNLEAVDGRSGSAQAIESAVDNLIAASTSADSPLPPPSRGRGPSPAVPARAQFVRQLFDPVAAVRVKAYGALLPRYANDPTLVLEVLEAARQHPKNANGTYNALVVLSHMNASSLRPHRDEIEAFAMSSQHVGPRVAERARTLIGRLPKNDPK